MMKWIKLENVDKLVNLDFVEYITKGGEEDEDDEEDTPFHLVLHTQDDPHYINYAKKDWRDRDFLEICRLLEERDRIFAYLTGNKTNVD